MSNIDKQAFRPDGGDIGSGRIREIANNPYGDEEKCWLAKSVLALLEENDNLLREKDVMEAAAQAMRDDMRDAREKLEAAEKRIAELEAREVSLTDINEYLAEVHDKTLNRAFRLLAEGVRAGDVAAMHAAGINVAAAGKGE